MCSHRPSKREHHSRELSVASVCTRLAVATKTCDLGKVEAKLVLQPVHRITRTPSENMNEVVAGEVASLEQRVEMRFQWC